MKITKGLKMKIFNGTLYLNDDITLEFKEAEMFLPGKTENLLEIHSDEIPPPPSINSQPLKEEKKKNVVKVEKVKIVKQPIKKQAVKESKPLSQKQGRIANPDRMIIKQEILDHMTSLNEISSKDLLSWIQSTRPEVDRKFMENICTELKQKNIIVSIGRALWKVTGNINKNEPKPDGRTGMSYIALQEKNIELESKYKYATGEPIIINDEVQILPEEEAVHEDDILLFDADYSGQFATVHRVDEGSNSITIKLKESGRQIIVYPHWIDFIKR